MGFFKDFKEDFSDAVNELVPGEEMKKEPVEKKDVYVQQNTEIKDEVQEQREMEKLAEEVSRGQAAVQVENVNENALITKRMTIKGNLESEGSIEVRGAVEGNISCNGKIFVTGMIAGDSASAEFVSDAARVQGQINASGTVQIGVDSVIIGNITASSAVIAGAVKGDIDVQGPVVIDASAVIKGNIKSRSVQINSGAIIEGLCSQTYAEVDIDSIFQ